jgi:fatty-acid peroxygenase
LVRDGYRFISGECDRAGSDITQVRVLGVPVVLMRGPAAARLFYSDRLQRHGASPQRLHRTLLGQGTVQGLDGERHHRRKAMFLSLLDPDRVEPLAAELARQWRHRLPSWELRQQVVLFDEVGELLCAAVCRWAGMPLPDSDISRRTRQIHALIDGPAAVGPRYWRARVARWTTQRWAAGVLNGVRTGTVPATDGSVLRTVAFHTDTDGTLLDARTAAAELLNVLRPVVAVDRFIAFAAVALQQHPQWRQRVATSEDDLDAFVQEVRRYYPFFPAVVGKAKAGFDWHGEHVPAGRRVVLDLYGTDHHPGSWSHPEVFDPDRFTHWADDRYTLIPQGGGKHATGHRCPGEWAVLALMRTAVRILSTDMTYQLPEQDLTVRLNRLPAQPESRVRLTHIHPANLRSEPGMVHPDPVRHPFTAGYEPLGGGAGDPQDGAPPPLEAAPEDDAGIPAAENPPTRQTPPGSDRDLADRLQVDPDRGDAKG